MSNFDRSLAGLEGQEMPDKQRLAWMEYPLVRALFERWRLPGEPSDAGGLRLAVRDGYLNFYVRGQSVAKLRPGPQVCKLEVHREYKDGQMKQNRKKGEALSGYCGITIGSGQEPTSQDLDRWIRTAVTYCGAEKAFVDDLVSENANIIDLEMALPARKKGGSAPRMDIVALQSSKIIFWEAKCSNNGELRSNSDYIESDEGKYLAGPKVIHQLRRYQEWLGHEGARETVIGGYANTMRIMLRLAEHFGKSGPALDLWKACDDPALLTVNTAPGIVIGNYSADGPINPKPEEYYSDRADSFARHCVKLHHGHQIQVEETSKGSLVLPYRHEQEIITKTAQEYAN